VRRNVVTLGPREAERYREMVDANYVATLEQHIRHDAASTRGVLALVVLVVIAAMLSFAWAQARFGHDEFRPRELS